MIVGDKSGASQAQAAAMRLSATRRMMKKSLGRGLAAKGSENVVRDDQPSGPTMASVPLVAHLADMASWQPVVDPVVSAIRRHPLVSLGVAAGVGVVVMTFKPWRWSFLQEQVRDWPDQVGHWASAQLSDPSVRESLVAWLSTLPHGVDAANDSAERREGKPVDHGSPDFSAQFRAQGGA